jgi:hypothetical protein
VKPAAKGFTVPKDSSRSVVAATRQEVGFMEITKVHTRNRQIFFVP